MRNLKRALSLALASVMLMGMMVVGTSAAGFPDVDANDNVEAIEVAQAIGIMIGDDKGNFNPDQKVTRNEMAAVIAKLLSLKAEDFKGVTNFTDVPDWADGFVGACYAAGIVAGYSDTTFGGNDGVTAAQAGLMVMKALGYFQHQSDYADDWQMAAVKQASKLELFEGVDTAVTAAMTRNEVAQLVLNALQITMVEAEENGLGVDSEGKLVSKYKYNAVYSDAAYATKIVAGTAVDGKYTVELGEKLFDGKLILDNVGETDDYGRAANDWYYGTKTADDLVGTYATETADYTLTATKDAKSLQYWLETIDKDFVVAGARFNGTDSTAADVQLGAEIEVYLNDDGDVEKVIVNTIELHQVTKVTAATNKDYDYTVKFDGKTWTDDKLPGFDAKAMVEDAYVLVLYNNNKSKVLEIAVPEYVEGKLTEQGSSYIKIDGTKYAALVSPANYDNTYKFYMGAGVVMGYELVEETATTDGFVYLVDAATKAYAGSTLGIGGNAAAVKVKVAYMDGTQETLDYVIKQATAAIAASATCPTAIAKDAYYIEIAGVKYEIAGDGTANGMSTALVEGAFYAYTKDEDGKIVLKALDADTDAAVSATIVEDSTSVATGYTANSATKVVVIDTTDKKTAEYVGYKNFPETTVSGTALVIHAKNSTLAKTVYVIGDVAEEDVTYAYATGETYTNTDGTFYEFIVDGVVAYYETSSAATKGDIYDLSYDSAAKVWDITPVSYATVIIADIDEYFVVTSAGATVEYAETYKVWDLTGDDAVAGEIADNDSVKYVVDTNGDIKVAFVIESIIGAQPETRSEAQTALTYSNPAFSLWYQLPTLGLTQEVEGHEVAISGKLTAVTAENFDDYAAAISQWMTTVATYDEMIAALTAEGWDMTNVTAVGFVLLQVDGSEAVTMLVNQDGNVRCLKAASTTLNWAGVEFDFAGLSF